MIPLTTLSFCITCKNRFNQVSQTLRKNLDDNRLHREWIEFVLVDFGSTDGLHDWIIANFIDDLKSGYLKYYYTDELRYWHMSIAKNTAHWCANHDIVVNLDCDNFTGYLGGQFVIRQFLKSNDIILHQFSGLIHDGSYGRIAVCRRYFDRVGGYDESFQPLGFDDIDLINRLWRTGLEYCPLGDRRYCKAIANKEEESIVNTNSTYSYSAMNNFNRIKSYRNINEGHLIANNGSYGIRYNLVDHTGRLLPRRSLSSVSNQSSNFYLKSKKNSITEVAMSLMDRIAKCSGFSSTAGLFNGKTGIAILMYHGSRFFRSALMESVADALIDDIIEEIQHINSLAFTKGLSGIAWGLNHLMCNGFIEFDATCFQDLDRAVFCDEEVPSKTDEAEYSFRGLYILSRYESSPDKSYWVAGANVYCNRMLKLLEIKNNLFADNPALLIPFFYFLLIWKEYDLPYKNPEIMEKVYQSFNKIIFSAKQPINSVFANRLYHELLQQDVSDQLPGILTITDINTIYLNQLLYPGVLLVPEKILRDCFSSIIADEKLQSELLLFLNPKTIGLSQIICGFAWSLLHYIQTEGVNEIS